MRLAVDPARFRAPRSHTVDEIGDPWLLDPGFEPWPDRLHFLVWANSYDARGDGEPIWWWAPQGRRGSAPPRRGDGAPTTWPATSPARRHAGVDRRRSPRRRSRSPIDGADGRAPRDGRARPRSPRSPRRPPPAAALAPDQLAAVAHGAGPARIIAPAGSGKTRVLTERLRHLLADRGYEPGAVVALAYNKKAQEEMASAPPGLGARIQTLNALGLRHPGPGLGRRPELLDEREVRRIVERLVPPSSRRVNTDPIAPYLDGLSLIRSACATRRRWRTRSTTSPAWPPPSRAYRDELRRRGRHRLRRAGLRRARGAARTTASCAGPVQAEHRHLLVDELQDLTPAHVLLVRLPAAPAADVFGVGDDDQTIYGHVGADPRFLIDYGRYFPGAAEHALEVNYRCPAPVTEAAATLLTYNRRAGRQGDPARPATSSPTPRRLRACRRHAADTGARALVDVVQGWLAEPGVGAGEVAVLARVQSLLLAPHVALAEAGVPVDSILDESVLSPPRRAGGARLPADRGRPRPRERRRPRRGAPPPEPGPARSGPSSGSTGAGRSTTSRRRRGRIDDAKVAQKLDDLAVDLDRLAVAGAAGRHDPRPAHRRARRHRPRLGDDAARQLRRASGSHLDDLEALLQVADLHPDAGVVRGVAARARSTASGPRAASRCRPIHRVKGREWDRVAVFGVTDGHRAAPPGRRTSRRSAASSTSASPAASSGWSVLGDGTRPSPFLAELTRARPRMPADELAARRARRRRPARAPRRAGHAGAGQGRAGGGGGQTDADPALVEALKAWRRERSKADGVPAYVVLNDRHRSASPSAAPPTSGPGPLPGHRPGQARGLRRRHRRDAPGARSVRELTRRQNRRVHRLTWQFQGVACRMTTDRGDRSATTPGRAPVRPGSGGSILSAPRRRASPRAPRDGGRRRQRRPGRRHRHGGGEGKRLGRPQGPRRVARRAPGRAARRRRAGHPPRRPPGLDGRAGRRGRHHQADPLLALRRQGRPGRGADRAGRPPSSTARCWPRSARAIPEQVVSSTIDAFCSFVETETELYHFLWYAAMNSPTRAGGAQAAHRRLRRPDRLHPRQRAAPGGGGLRRRRAVGLRHRRHDARRPASGGSNAAR